MAQQDLQRLLGELPSNKDLAKRFASLGHDTGAFVTTANSLGYKITQDDVNSYLVQKLGVKTTGRSAADGSVSTVTTAATVAVAVTVAGAATAVGVVAVEVAVLS